jgi:hypothetical protein
MLSQENKNRIADDLLGTCSSGDSLAEEFGVDVLEIQVAAEECEVIRCEGCSWWCELHEMNENNECEDCVG